jgi:hypothetical protein
MNSNMIRTLVAGMAFACLCLSPALSPTVQAQSPQAQQVQLHPHQIQQLIADAAAYWDITVGKARQAYRHGELVFTIVDVKPGLIEVMLEYDGECNITFLTSDI